MCCVHIAARLCTARHMGLCPHMAVCACLSIHTCVLTRLCMHPWRGRYVCMWGCLCTRVCQAPCLCMCVCKPQTPGFPVCVHVHVSRIWVLCVEVCATTHWRVCPRAQACVSRVRVRGHVCAGACAAHCPAPSQSGREPRRPGPSPLPQQEAGTQCGGTKLYCPSGGSGALAGEGLRVGSIAHHSGGPRCQGSVIRATAVCRCQSRCCGGVLSSRRPVTPSERCQAPSVAVATGAHVSPRR